MAERTMIQSWYAYQRDFWERSILFWDILRERGINMLEHERQGLPVVLWFEHEQIVDARRFERPVNYALLRIVRIKGRRWDDRVDESKAPVIVIDPRAGHGPGIGGFNLDSEVGMALREGHPVYFVIFFPESCAGQTLGTRHQRGIERDRDNPQGARSMDGTAFSLVLRVKRRM